MPVADMFIPERTWWEHITGPSQVVRYVVARLQERQNVLLQVPNDLPWRKQMRGSVQSNLRENYAELLVADIDCNDECPNTDDIGAFLLKRFAGKEIRNGYRKTSGQTIQEYIKNRNVLKNQIVWVKGIGCEQTKKWYDFCIKYQPTTMFDGLFVIEVHDNNLPKNTPSHVARVQYDKFVGNYDALLFDSILSAKKSWSTAWKQYVAAATASLCGCDAEVSALFIEETDFAQEDLIDSLKKIIASGCFPKRGQSGLSINEHPFSLLYEGKEKELEKRIWEAQLQIAFPIIEQERVMFIRKWEAYIQSALDENRDSITQFGNEIENPYDAELGLLTYIITHKNAGESKYMLYIPVEEDRERLLFLHQRRNELAHLKICTPQSLEELFSKHPFFVNTY
jgi:hypothetical protein